MYMYFILIWFIFSHGFFTSHCHAWNDLNPQMRYCVMRSSQNISKCPQLFINVLSNDRIHVMVLK